MADVLDDAELVVGTDGSEWAVALRLADGREWTRSVSADVGAKLIELVELLPAGIEGWNRLGLPAALVVLGELDARHRWNRRRALRELSLDDVIA